MNWKLWLQGLLAATIGGAAGTVTSVVTDPSHLASGHFGQVGSVAATGAIIGLVGYLVKSPLDRVELSAPSGAKEKPNA